LFNIQLPIFQSVIRWLTKKNDKWLKMSNNCKQKIYYDDTQFGSMSILTFKIQLRRLQHVRAIINDIYLRLQHAHNIEINVTEKHFSFLIILKFY
jgi:hypothetical protein